MFRFLCAAAFAVSVSAAWADPLPSWSDTEARTRIIDFVDSVTTPGTATYVPPGDLDEFVQALFETGVFLAQRRYLALDQRHGAARYVRQPERTQQVVMPLEKIRILGQVVVDGLVGRQFTLVLLLRLRAHG